MKPAYRVTLTGPEYNDAMIMSDRGYLGMLTVHATYIEGPADDGLFELQFTESDAWKVLETIEDDPHAVWALTLPSTSLGEKFQRFVDSIV